MIEVASVAGLVTVQDGGRPGRMHEGIPVGGPVVPELLARANAAVRNAPGVAALEVIGAVRLRARGAVALGTELGAALMATGEERTFPSSTEFAVHYVAVRGGIDVPVVLGGRGTLVVGGFGGHHGRPLRSGDVLDVGASPECAAAVPPPPEARGPVRVVVGPDLDCFAASALDVLLSSTFTVTPRSDRVGTRLSGPTLAGAYDAAAPSAPMVRGAIQVPPSGELIVLGPDHPTTGGYPVIATVIRAHLGRLAARPAGAHVQFVTSSDEPSARDAVT